MHTRQILAAYNECVHSRKNCQSQAQHKEYVDGTKNGKTKSSAKPLPVMPKSQQSENRLLLYGRT